MKIRSALYLFSFICLTSIVDTQDETREFWITSAQKTLQEALKHRDNLKVAKNVILFLGDGMGVSTVTAARIYKGQKNGRPGEETVLNFEKFPNIALSKTYNVDRQVPDSAGTATAYLCGVKANLGTLGVDSSVARKDCTNMAGDTAHVSSMLDWSLDAGKSVGFVTTTRVTHASPAASYAHTPDRDWESSADVPDTCSQVKDIAYQLIKGRSDIHVMLGGGRQEFFDRSDQLNLTQDWLSRMKDGGLAAQYVENAEQFRAVSASDTDYLLGLFASGHMTYEVERNPEEEPSLSEMVVTAINILKKNDKGFFLFVEGGRIDHGHHDNWAKRALEEAVAFDDALGVAKSMTGDDTLIVVTADHSHVFNIAGYPSRGNNILGLVAESDPERIPTDGMPYSTIVYGNGPGPGRELNLSTADMNATDFKFPRAVPLGPGKETHSGEDVAIYASGPMAHLFHGVHEQNYIAHVMGYAACVGPHTPRDCPQRGGFTETTCSGAAGSRDRVVGRVYVLTMLVTVVGCFTALLWNTN